MASWCPVARLWLSTDAVQLIIPIGDDGQLMSGGPPVLWLSTNAVPSSAFNQVLSVNCFPLIVYPSSVFRQVFFRQVFSINCFPSSVFQHLCSSDTFVSFQAAGFSETKIILVIAFLKISPLVEGTSYFLLQIRNLCEISSLEPAPKVWNPKSRSPNKGFWMCCFKTYFPLFLVSWRS